MQICMVKQNDKKNGIIYLENMKKFAERLKELRNEQNISHDNLGKIIGVNGSTISRWENDKVEPTAPNICELAKFFNVSADYLLGLID